MIMLCICGTDKFKGPDLLSIERRWVIHYRDMEEVDTCIIFLIQDC